MKHRSSSFNTTTISFYKVLLPAIFSLGVASGCLPGEKTLETERTPRKAAANVENAPQQEIGTETQNYIVLDKGTKITTENGDVCYAEDGTVIEFEYYEEDGDLWEFKLTSPLIDCPASQYAQLSIDSFTMRETLSGTDEKKTFPTLGGDIEDPSNRPLPAKPSDYVSKDGFQDYSKDVASEFFPLPRYPDVSYETGARYFGAPRANGRKHAANDLVIRSGTPIYAVANGKIIDRHYFYSGTYALVVKHEKYLVRYGEVSSKNLGLKIGDQVKAGQKIAEVGLLNSGSSMLHFEKYQGTKTGPLTVRSNMPYQRRSDLMRPTEFLRALESSYPR